MYYLKGISKIEFDKANKKLNPQFTTVNEEFNFDV
jgi:hypothetical protein